MPVLKLGRYIDLEVAQLNAERVAGACLIDADVINCLSDSVQRGIAQAMKRAIDVPHGLRQKLP